MTAVSEAGWRTEMLQAGGRRVRLGRGLLDKPERQMNHSSNAHVTCAALPLPYKGERPTCTVPAPLPPPLLAARTSCEEGDVDSSASSRDKPSSPAISPLALSAAATTAAPAATASAAVSLANAEVAAMPLSLPPTDAAFGAASSVAVLRSSGCGEAYTGGAGAGAV